MRKPIVAIVGRPNVGKSTFVNRLIGSRNSIVDDLPGVTRDRIYFDVEWQNKIFTVIDTGGIVPGDEDEIMISIFDQAKIACEEADKIIFIVDGKEGVNPVDYDIANILRQSGKPVFLAVNKSDNPDSLMMVNDFYSLAIGDPIGISALHGSGGVGEPRAPRGAPRHSRGHHLRENARVGIASRRNSRCGRREHRDIHLSRL